MEPSMSHFSAGDHVTWRWAGGSAKGRIEEVHRKRVRRTIKGKTITRNASSDKPAYLVVQEDGDKALKSHSELEAGK
jgi:N-methylhydantoinase B/oxoprolinase/acetone carboxylase alpha subunit